MTELPRYAITKQAQPLKVRCATVADVIDYAPGFRRVIFESDDFADFPALSPVSHVKFFIPAPDGTFVPPTRDESGLDKGTPGTVRDYTVVAHEGTRITLDIALHDHGAVTNWARTAAVGSPAAFLGPKSVQIMPDAPRYLLGADESAFPALCGWCSLVGTRATVLAFAHADSLEYLRDVDVDVIHVPNPNEIVSTLESLDLNPDCFAWFAGEAGALVPVRAWLRAHSGIRRENIKVDGYWKIGVAARDHHAPLDPEAGE